MSLRYSAMFSSCNGALASAVAAPPGRYARINNGHTKKEGGGALLSDRPPESPQAAAFRWRNSPRSQPAVSRGRVPVTSGFPRTTDTITPPRHV